MAQGLKKFVMAPDTDPRGGISPLGLGTVKFGRNTGVKYPGGAGFALPGDAEISSILDLCIDRGINYLDTAPAYGTSEERLGGILGARRHKFYLGTKTGEEFDGTSSQYIFTKEHTRMSVERSLKRLNTDFLDIVFVHAPRADCDVFDKTDVIETLYRLKAEGKIGAVGASTATVAGGRRAAELCDALMVSYNSAYQDERAVIDAAADLGCAVFVKKGLASGHSTDPASDIRFVCQTPGVTSLVIGSLNPANILANIKALSKG